MEFIGEVILPLSLSLINEKKVTSNDIRFFLGYSGWDGNQLEKELQSNSWVVVRKQLQNGNYFQKGRFLLERKNAGTWW